MDEVYEVEVPGAVIRSTRPLSPADVQGLRNHFRTPGDVAAALAMGDALGKSIQEWAQHIDRIVEEHS